MAEPSNSAAPARMLIRPAVENGQAEPAGSPQRRARPRSPRGAIVCAGVLVLLLLAGQTPPGLALLRALGVLQGPAGYTELAFVPSLTPPQSSVRGGQVDFAFTVDDEQGAAAGYTWRVVESADSGPSVQSDSGTLRLADGATGTVSARVRMPSTGERVVITVELLDTGQVIHYAVELKGSA
jgi:hypothetical protein